MEVVVEAFAAVGALEVLLVLMPPHVIPQARLGLVLAVALNACHVRRVPVNDVSPQGFLALCGEPAGLAVHSLLPMLFHVSEQATFDRRPGAADVAQIVLHQILLVRVHVPREVEVVDLAANRTSLPNVKVLREIEKPAVRK